MPGKITVIGSANVDFVMPLPHLPAPGESVNGGPFRQSFGGKGSNQALAARRAGADVAAVFSLGDDAYAKQLLATYRHEGVDTKHVWRNPGIPCGTGVILVGPDGNNLLGTDLGANAMLSVDQVDAAEEAIAASDIVMLQMEIPDPSIRRAIALAARHNVDVMLNFAPARQSDVALTGKIAVLVVNEVEAGALCEMPVKSPAQAMSAATVLAEKGHRHVIVTLGDRGCVVRSERSAKYFPAFSVAALDATGAGDSFCGALAVALAEGKQVEEAARFANAAGALCATRMGAMPSIPRRDEIEQFLAGFNTCEFSDLSRL